MKVSLIDHMGSDLTVVNAARVSFDKESNWVDGAPQDDIEDIDWKWIHSQGKTLSEADRKLINYLATHGHWTPFAHPQATFRVTAPIFVRTQCFKHKVGFVENEISRRYVETSPTFYLPNEWRGRPINAKQGSSGPIDSQSNAASWYMDAVDKCYASYQQLLSLGVAPEQARMVLPQSMMTEWYWTGSLAAYARFCKQRLDAHAQQETAYIAGLISQEMSRLFPVSWGVLTKETTE